MGLSWLLALLLVFMQAPVLEGNATFYAEPYIGRTMQNGSTYTGQDATCAVSADRWAELAGARLLVCAVYEQSYDESMHNLCSYGSAMGCEPLQRREMHEAAAISSGEVLPTSRLESCTTQPKCIIVTVTDTGSAQEFEEHGVVLDLSVTAFRALIGPLGIGVQEVQAWKIE